MARPPRRSMLTEAFAPLEIARELLLREPPSHFPRGDGHPVLLLPAFTTGERELRPLARFLTQLGYAVQDWGEGRNLGLRRAVLERTLARLARIVERAGRPASLIGWSGGGLYAREIARLRPALVRRVITLGTPIHLATAAPAYVEQARRRVEDLALAIGLEGFEPLPAPPPVPCTAIHSKRDGIVDWRATLESPGPGVENLEVGGTHLALPFRREVQAIIADRLARAVPAGAGKRPRRRPAASPGTSPR